MEASVLKRMQMALGEANYVPYVLIVSTGLAIIGIAFAGLASFH
jgi:hypothetical protein